MKISTVILSQFQHYLRFGIHRKQVNSFRNQPCLQRGLIFVHVPKCAGTSFLESLFGQQTGLGHKTARQYLRIYGFSPYIASYKFGFVRNPYDRLVSAFEYLRKGGNNSSDREFSNRHMKHFKGFDDFILEGLSKSGEIRNHLHFKKQSHFLCIDGAVAVDFVGRFENIEEDFAYLSRQFGKHKDLSPSNASRKDQTYEHYYANKEVLNMVNQLYLDDFSTFNYEMMSTR
jgi:hypothetical protein